MKPILFKPNDTTFNGNGLGVFNDVLECVVHEQLNGIYELNMTMLASDVRFNDLQLGSIIVVQPNAIDSRQPFVVSDITKEIDGQVEVYAVHLAQYWMRYTLILPFSSANMANALTNLDTKQYYLQDHKVPFTFNRKFNKTAIFRHHLPYTLMDLLLGLDSSIVNVYGAELKYNNLEITVSNRRGSDRGLTVLYGKNMTDFSVNEFNNDWSYDGVVVYWYSEEEGLTESDTFGIYPFDDSKPYQRMLLLDVTEEYNQRYGTETKPASEDLQAIAGEKAFELIKQATNIHVSFDALSSYGMNASTYSDLQLGDTVTIRNSMYNIEYQSRIVETFWNVLLDRYDDVIVGDTMQEITSVVADIAKQATAGEQVHASDVLYASGAVSANTAQGAIDYIGTQMGSIASDVSSLQSNVSSLQTTANQYTSRFNTQLASPNLDDVNYNYVGYVTNSTNAPSGVSGSGQLIVASRNTTTSTWCVQLFSPYNVDDIYTRTNNGGTWTSWIKLADMNDLGKQVLGWQRVSVTNSTSVANYGTASLKGTMTAVTGATDYILIAERVNYGFFTGNPSRSGTTITCNAMNSSGASHTLSGTVIVIALK